MFGLTTYFIHSLWVHNTHVFTYNLWKRCFTSETLSLHCPWYECVYMINRKHTQWRIMNNYKFLLPYELNKGGEEDNHWFYSIANMLAFEALWRTKKSHENTAPPLHVFPCIWNWWCALYGFNSTSTNGMESTHRRTHIRFL